VWKNRRTRKIKKKTGVLTANVLQTFAIKKGERKKKGVAKAQEWKIGWTLKRGEAASKHGENGIMRIFLKSILCN